MTYQKNGTLATQAPAPAPIQNQNEEKGVRVNGYAQVVELLKSADPEFRISLLRRLSKEDPRLGASLRQALEEGGYL